MSIDETLRRHIGRKALAFCRRCLAFLPILGPRPGMNFDAPTAEEALREAYAREGGGRAASGRATGTTGGEELPWPS